MSVFIKRALCKEFLAFYVTVTKPGVDVFALITSMKERDVRILKIFKVATICIQTRA